MGSYTFTQAWNWRVVTKEMQLCACCVSFALTLGLSVVLRDHSIHKHFPHMLLNIIFDLDADAVILMSHKCSLSPCQPWQPQDFPEQLGQLHITWVFLYMGTNMYSCCFSYVQLLISMIIHMLWSVKIRKLGELINDNIMLQMCRAPHKICARFVFWCIMAHVILPISFRVTLLSLGELYGNHMISQVLMKHPEVCGSVYHMNSWINHILTTIE